MDKYAVLVILLALSRMGLGKMAECGPASTGSVLWREPADIASRDLFYGPGGKSDEPPAHFTFVEEDLVGISPKIVLRDKEGVKWTAKFGSEARPETVATRLI